MNITEDYCSYEVAKLLKEKGFNEPCIRQWDCDDHSLYGANNIPISNSELQANEYNGFSAPTHQMAMKWLREKYKIMITIIPQEVKVGIDKMCYAIYKITKDLYQPLYNGNVDNLVDSYEEAVEAALKYSLENLI